MPPQVLEGTKYKNIIPLLKGCTAIAYGKDSDIVSDLVSVTKSEGKLHLLGGIVDDQMVTPQELQSCAQLPPLGTQHLMLSQYMMQLQSSLSNNLLHNQQTLRHFLKQIPDL